MQSRKDQFVLPIHLTIRKAITVSLSSPTPPPPDGTLFPFNDKTLGGISRGMPNDLIVIRLIPATDSLGNALRSLHLCPLLEVVSF